AGGPAGAEAGPVGDLNAQVDRLLVALRGLRKTKVRAWVPPLSAWEARDEYLLRLDVPGVPREAIDMMTRGRALLVRGARPDPETIHAPVVARAREPQHGTFSRVVLLPDDAALDRIRATIDNGCLEVRVPRVADARSVAIR